MGFGQDLEFHARSIETYQSPPPKEEIWLGFDRAIPIDPQTNAVAGAFREKLRQSFMDDPDVKKLSPKDRALFEIALAHLFENDLEVRKTESKTFEVVLSLSGKKGSEGKEIRDEEVASNLKETNPFPSTWKYRRLFNSVCKKINITELLRASATAQQIPGNTPSVQALIAFDTDPLIFNQLQKVAPRPGGVSSHPSQKEVEKTVNHLMVYVDGKPVPVIPWTVAQICADYDTQFELRQLASKGSRGKYTERISKKRKFF